MKITTVILALLVMVGVYCAQATSHGLGSNVGQSQDGEGAKRNKRSDTDAPDTDAPDTDAPDTDAPDSPDDSDDWDDTPIELLLFYHENEGIPAAARIMAAEQAGSNESTVDGSIANAYPFYVGIVIDLMSGQTSMCGASMLSDTRALTAAHCWRDRRHQARLFTLVFGSPRLFSGGIRVATSDVKMYFLYSRNTLDFDVAIINYEPFIHNDDIKPVALPSGPLLRNSFEGVAAAAVGFYSTSNSSITQKQVKVINKSECPLLLPYMMCVRVGRRPCRGEGGPLIATINETQFLIGVMAFGYNNGNCQFYWSATVAKVTYFVRWINSLL